MADYKTIADPTAVPDGYQLMAPGATIAVNSLWLHDALASVSRNLDKREKRAAYQKKKNPEKKRRNIDLDSETVKKLMDGFYDPWDLAIEGGTKAFENDERFLSIKGMKIG